MSDLMLIIHIKICPLVHNMNMLYNLTHPTTTSIMLYSPLFPNTRKAKFSIYYLTISLVHDNHPYTHPSLQHTTSAHALAEHLQHSFSNIHFPFWCRLVKSFASQAGFLSSFKLSLKIFGSLTISLMCISFALWLMIK